MCFLVLYICTGAISSPPLLLATPVLQTSLEDTGSHHVCGGLEGQQETFEIHLGSCTCREQSQKRGIPLPTPQNPLSSILFISLMLYEGYP
jgi:hypothetical protein